MSEAKPVKLVDVVATAEGYDGAAIRKEGEAFQMPEGATGSWFKPAGKAGKTEAGPVSEGPTAKEVIASLAGLTDEQLAEVAIAEDDRAGGARSSVVKAIDAEQAKRAKAKAEADAAAAAKQDPAAPAGGGGGSEDLA